MARARSFSRGSRGVKNWTGFVVGDTLVTSTQVILFQFTSGAVETILRVRGVLRALAIPDTALDETTLGLGLIVVSDSAAAAGGVSVPGPAADFDSPWVWHQFVPLISAAATAASDVAIGLQDKIVVDSKAMRKLGAAETLVMVAQITNSQFVTVRVQGGVRLLALAG